MPDSAYGTTSRILHRLALASPAVAQVSHDLESLLNRNTASAENGRHVFVSGLARAGTTVVMRCLYQSGLFRSLTYRDMPFVLMPRTWSGVSSLFRRNIAQAERAHGDRVMVDFDSPEAFEEVFWRSFCCADYIFDQALRPHRADSETIVQFRRFVGNVLASGAPSSHSRYLSKNNNNLLRLPSIAEAFPNAVMLIPYRDPLQHTLSLERQHQRFMKTHAEDVFALDYMNWLGHHEFGANHKPFRFGNIATDSAFPLSGKRELATKSPATLNYWLDCWSDAYTHVLEHLPGNARLVSYERLCDRSSGELEKLLSHVGVTARDWIEEVSLSQPEPRDVPDTSRKVRAHAYEVYDALNRIDN